MEYSANEFIGGELWTTNTPVNVYSGTDTTKFVYSIPKNSFVGKIYAYVVHDGKVWWQIDNKNLNRFVKHETGVFDFNKLVKSIELLKEKEQQEIDEKVQERMNNNDPVGNYINSLKEMFGGLFKPLAYFVGLLIVIEVIKSR